jgi:ribosome biogenesis GTPase
MSKKKKIRVDLRRNRSRPPRETGWTRDYHEHGFEEDDALVREERVRAKGELSRKRTIVTEVSPEAEPGAAGVEMPAVDLEACLPGRVLRVQGLHSLVATAAGGRYRCAVRRLLRNLVIDERNVVAAGDQVWIRPAGAEEGLIERVEPRHGVLARDSRGREHVLVANVDQIVVVVSVAEPELKPHLVDRYLVSAEQGRIAPIICINKADLADAADLQPVVGLYSQLGIRVLLTSAVDGRGIESLRRELRDRETVFAGQSGVGKSSLLNSIQPGLNRLVREVSESTQKGKHTTTTAELLPLEEGGWVVDTPGIRQFALWKIIPEELEGFFPEFRPYVYLCRYAGCKHMQEEGCAIKEAVAGHRISMQRYESYLGILAGAEQ